MESEEKRHKKDQMALTERTITIAPDGSKTIVEKYVPEEQTRSHTCSYMFNGT